MMDRDFGEYRMRDLKAAWRSLTATDPPDDLWGWLEDVDAVVKFLGGQEAALRSTQVMALAIVLRWRLADIFNERDAARDAARA